MDTLGVRLLKFSRPIKQWQQLGAQVRLGEKGTPVVSYKEVSLRGGGGDGPISGQFEGAAAETTCWGTDLPAKTSHVFNAAQVEGDVCRSCPHTRVGWTAMGA